MVVSLLTNVPLYSIIPVLSFEWTNEWMHANGWNWRMDEWMRRVKEWSTEIKNEKKGVVRLYHSIFLLLFFYFFLFCQPTCFSFLVDGWMDGRVSEVIHEQIEKCLLAGLIVSLFLFVFSFWRTDRTDGWMDWLMGANKNNEKVMDAALLLVAGNETCPQPQTSEHLAAVEIMRLQNIIILQNKVIPLFYFILFWTTYFHPFLLSFE